MSDYSSSSGYSSSSSSGSSGGSTNSLSAVLTDPLHVSLGLFVGLILFVFYLLLPRGVRKQYFGAYPKRHQWSARSRFGAGSSQAGAYSESGTGAGPAHILVPSGGGVAMTGVAGRRPQQPSRPGKGYGQTTPHSGSRPGLRGIDEEHTVLFDSGSQQPRAPPSSAQDEIVVSAAMQQLRDPGVLIIAHGSRGRPKSVRLVLTESAISWRTETRKAGAAPKVGKLHQVPLAHIMYVDVGKQTTALRRVENAAVPENLCFSLLTKEGSLDLEANSPRERDALVSCFSLVLDEVHAQNWRDIYRGPSSDMPSSFDEVDQK